MPTTANEITTEESQRPRIVRTEHATKRWRIPPKEACDATRRS
jgi:hypothetical protein